MIAVRSSPCVWMAMAFCASLGLAIGVLAFFGDEQRGVNIALQATARLAFLFFWPAYVGGALTFLFGDFFLPIRRHARELGLALCGRSSCTLRACCPPLRHREPSVARDFRHFWGRRGFRLSACSAFRRSSSTSAAQRILANPSDGCDDLHRLCVRLGFYEAPFKRFPPNC
jgi:hypothetical protein